MSDEPMQVAITLHPDQAVHTQLVSAIDQAVGFPIFDELTDEQRVAALEYVMSMYGKPDELPIHYDRKGRPTREPAPR